MEYLWQNKSTSHFIEKDLNVETKQKARILILRYKSYPY